MNFISNKYFFVLSFTLLCWSSSCLIAAPTTNNSDKISEILTLANNFRIINAIPGFGLSVIQNNKEGKLEIAEGFGLRDRALQLDANNKTLFAIGSNSKGFSAVMVVKILHEKFEHLGEAVLDTPIVQLVPDFEFILSDRFRTNFVTFRDILAMRVCISSGGGLTELFATAVSKEDFYYRLRYYNETCSIRNGLEYSNILYGLAGEIVAHLSNLTVEQTVLNFMKDLEMNDSSFFDMEGEYEHHPNIAKAYYRRLGVVRQVNNTMLKRVAAALTAGAILTSQEDMVKYMNFHLNKGKVGDRQVVPEEVLNWVYKSSNNWGEPNVGRKSDDQSAEGVYGYGFGYMLGLIDGYYFFGHGGFYPPYNSRLSIFPDLNIGIYTVSNGPGPTGMGTGITQELLHKMIYNILRKNSTVSMEELTKLALTPSQLSMNFKNELDLNWLTSHKSSTQNKPKQSPVKLSDSDITGIYGRGDTGDIVIYQSEADGQLSIDFGDYAKNGKLERIQGSNSSFTIKFSSNTMELFYVFGELLMPKFGVHFPNENELQFEFGNFAYSFYTQFDRNATIDTFPLIPWEKDSCGPSR